MYRAFYDVGLRTGFAFSGCNIHPKNCSILGGDMIVKFHLICISTVQFVRLLSQCFASSHGQCCALTCASVSSHNKADYAVCLYSCAQNVTVCCTCPKKKPTMQQHETGYVSIRVKTRSSYWQYNHYCYAKRNRSIHRNAWTPHQWAGFEFCAHSRAWSLSGHHPLFLCLTHTLTHISPYLSHFRAQLARVRKWSISIPSQIVT